MSYSFNEAYKREDDDPSTYEHVETKYEIREYYALVVTKFRGTNAFGGKVLDRVYAQVTTKGDIMETAKSDIWGERDIELEIKRRHDKYDSIEKSKK